MDVPSEPKKILWAVDAFDDPERLRTHAPELLRAFARYSPLLVQPVYILSPGQINLSVEFSGPWITEYRPAAEKALNQALQDVNVPGLLPAQVIVENFSSTSQSANALVNHALALGADFILVSSHGRKGMSRLLLGSFAETLLFYSKVPVLVIGRKTAFRMRSERSCFRPSSAPVPRRSFEVWWARRRPSGEGGLISRHPPSDRADSSVRGLSAGRILGSGARVLFD